MLRFSTAISPILVIVLCTGCGLTSDTEPSSPDEGPVIPGRLSATPPELQFQERAEGAYARRTIYLANTGQGDLVIRQLAVKGRGVFTLSTDDPTATLASDGAHLPPSQGIHLEVVYHGRRPANGDARILVESNDPGRAVFEIPLQVVHQSDA